MVQLKLNCILSHLVYKNSKTTLPLEYLQRTVSGA